MARLISISLGLFAAVGGSSPCNGGALVSEPPDASTTPSGGAVQGGTSAPGPGQGAAGGTTGLVTLAGGQTCPWGMAIDATSVYWTECGDPTGGYVLKVPKAGGQVVTLASGDRLSGIAVDSSSVYWVAGSPDGMSGAIMKAPLGGGAATTLAARMGTPSHIAVDETSVYWIETFASAVMKVPIGGGTPSSVAAASLAQNFALDQANIYLAGNGVSKVPKAGGAAVQLSQSSFPLPASGIAVNATDVYWTSGPPGGASGVVSVSVDGGMQTMVYADSQSTSGGPLTLDAKSVYWANGSNLVMSVPLVGGNATTLATGQTNVVAITVDATNLYWLVNDNAASGGGSVVKLALPPAK